MKNATQAMKLPATAMASTLLRRIEVGDPHPQPVVGLSIAPGYVGGSGAGRKYALCGGAPRRYTEAAYTDGCATKAGRLEEVPPAWADWLNAAELKLTSNRRHLTDSELARAARRAPEPCPPQPAPRLDA